MSGSRSDSRAQASGGTSRKCIRQAIAETRDLYQEGACSPQNQVARGGACLAAVMDSEAA